MTGNTEKGKHIFSAPDSNNANLLESKQRVGAKEVRAADKTSVAARLEAGLENIMDSDSESELDGSASRSTDHQDPSSYKFNHAESIFREWSLISLHIKYEATHRMKICVFWLPILLQRLETHHAFRWALQINLIDRKEDLTIKRLQKIEILEAIFRAMERGILDLDQAKSAVWISDMFSLRFQVAFADAMHWLVQTGEPGIDDGIRIFGNEQTCFMVLDFVFRQYASYIKTMGANVRTTLESLMTLPASYNIHKSDKMKEKGNEYFQKEQYEEAVKFYTEAINNYPDNHIIYGNRALCYIRSKKYLKAVCDGKRAILIEPLWPKGHYRYCEALFFLGEVQMAINANNLAMNLCRGNKNGIKDLEQQRLKLHGQTAGCKVSVEEPMTTQKKREHAAESGPANDSASNKLAPAASRDGPATNLFPTSGAGPAAKKLSQNKMGKKTRKNEKTVVEESGSRACESAASEITSKTQQVETGSHAGSSNATKKKPKSKKSENQKTEGSKAKLFEELSRTVRDALTNLHSPNAEQAFRQALALLETTTPKDLGLSNQDVLLLLYGHASVLTDIGQQEELAEAKRILEKMKAFEERMFQCLVFYGMGRVFLRENRFSAALQPFRESLQMVQNHLLPGKLTWPFTKELVVETQPNYLKEALEGAIDLCRFPPTPDATCRSEKCCGKPEIYLTDPDFKGFIRICCCQSCVVEYHTVCWKTYKTSSRCEKNEKDFLQGPCLTPDCIGQICSMEIFDQTGQVKFKETISKAVKPKKPKLAQKCARSKKLKCKEEHLIKGKRQKQACQETEVTNSEVLQQKEDSASQSSQKAWLLYRDRVLLQISQNMELLREEKSHHVATLASALKPWLKLDLIKNNQLALKLLSWENERLETLGQFAEVLLERKNRVWARVFIQVLSKSAGLNPKLYNWACSLNDTGLNAAKSFLERFSRELEQLDLSILLKFEPLEEMIIEKLDAKPELISSIGLSVTEYLKQAPAQDTRLFIWALEEHRDQYVPLHSILDDYFDVMDGRCSIRHKTNEIKNNSPIKNRVRKKKQKEPKAVFPLHGAIFRGRGGVTSREDRDFLQDEPFHPAHVPTHIQEQIADFELQYNSTRHSGQNNLLDNSPHRIKESLYDYFAQILEASGPLAPDDPLLVGQLVHFPPVVQDSIRDSGGMQTFLLQSPRFIRWMSYIWLAQHVDSLQPAEGGASLDQLDDIDYLDMNAASAYPHASAFTSYNHGYFPATSEVYPVFANTRQRYFNPPAPPPDVAQSFTGTALAESGLSSERADVDSRQPSPHFSSVHEEEVDLYSAEADVVVENGPSSSSVAAEENVLWRPAALQASQETKRSVAVNTEMHERFETQLGDINKMQKSITSMEEQMEKISSGREEVHLEDLTGLKDEIEKITANTQVTKSELSMFQQKLEEEVKNDQKEKKANQQVLKSLKVESERLIEEQKSLSQKLREANANYDTILEDFLASSNQLAAEKRNLEEMIQRCKTQLSLATRRCLTAQTLYQEEVDQSKSSRRISEQPLFGTNDVAEAPPPNGARGSPVPSFSSPPYVQPSAAEATSAPVQHKPPDASLEHPGSTMFDKVMEQLAAMFPHYTRSRLKTFVQEFRSSSGGTLSSMPFQDMVGGVTQLILDYQEKQNSTLTSAGHVAESTPPPAWHKPKPPQRPIPKEALNIEDPCIICHEDMGPDETCVLECRHSFHDHCIRPWLKDHKTCPTCRDYTLLPDEFPALCTKRRKAP